MAKKALITGIPEYLIAKHPGKLILNLIDTDNVGYVLSEIIDAAIVAIDENISQKKVLVHCNQDISRSATIGLLYLHHAGLYHRGHHLRK